MLIQNDKIKKCFDNLDFQERLIQKAITNEIDDIFYLLEDIKKQNIKIKELGDVEGLKKEITKLDSEVKDLKERSGLSQEEIKTYNESVEKINSNNREIEQGTKDQSIINNFSLNDILKDPMFSDLSEKTQKELSDSYETLSKKFKEDLTTLFDKKRGDLNKFIQSHHSQNNKIMDSIKDLIVKVKSHNLLNKKIEKLKEENGKYREITDKQNVKKAYREKLSSKIENLIKLHKSFFQTLSSHRDEIVQNNDIETELKFDIKIQFNLTEFKNTIFQYFNQRYINNSLLNLTEFKHESNSAFENHLQILVSELIDEKIVLKSFSTYKETILKLLKNWYLFDFQVSHNNDIISQMSPGKKSFVLLKLLIELDNSQCPILLDQPEDDLDNRSIYNELVHFIRTKKKDRQILIVTHNPNLVIGSDAEQIIVANQHGDKNPNNTFKFDYKSGALENTYSAIEEVNTTLEKQGIKEHVCEILEGGKQAFECRANKYNL